jgi:hypothetical protein
VRKAKRPQRAPPSDCPPVPRRTFEVCS